MLTVMEWNQAGMAEYKGPVFPLATILGGYN